MTETLTAAEALQVVKLAAYLQRVIPGAEEIPARCLACGVARQLIPTADVDRVIRFAVEADEPGQAFEAAARDVVDDRGASWEDLRTLATTRPPATRPPPPLPRRFTETSSRGPAADPSTRTPPGSEQQCLPFFSNP